MLSSGPIASSIAKKILDSFQGIGSLLNRQSELGQFWTESRTSPQGGYVPPIRPITTPLNEYKTSNGVLTNNTYYPEEYPVAGIQLGNYDATISADVNPGTGVVFWMDGAGYWAAYSFESSSTYKYNDICSYSSCGYVTQTGCYGACPPTGGSPDTNNCGACYDWYCSKGCPYGGSLYYGSLCVTQMCGSFPCKYYTPVENCFGAMYASTGCAGACGNAVAPSVQSWTCGPCWGCTPVNYVCERTGITNTSYIKLIKNVAGIITEVLKVSIPARAESISVTTSGKNITIQAYADNNMSVKIGADIKYIAETDPTGAYVGIITAPSDRDQSRAIANFSATI